MSRARALPFARRSEPLIAPEQRLSWRRRSGGEDWQGADRINSSLCAAFAQSDTDSIRVRSSQASPWGTGGGSKSLAKHRPGAHGRDGSGARPRYNSRNIMPPYAFVPTEVACVGCFSLPSYLRSS
jgi:hypothetical protein